MQSTALDGFENSTVPPQRSLRTLVASELNSNEHCSPNWLTFEPSDGVPVLRCKVGGYLTGSVMLRLTGWFDLELGCEGEDLVGGRTWQVVKARRQECLRQLVAHGFFGFGVVQGY
jgi:hypothetical protein